MYTGRSYPWNGIWQNRSFAQDVYSNLMCVQARECQKRSKNRIGPESLVDDVV